MIKPCRGEIWLADLGQPMGHEQRGLRPVLIISDNNLNHGVTELGVRQRFLHFTAISEYMNFYGLQM